MKKKSLSELIQELRRRRVFRGIVVYGASTLILLEAADNISNAFGAESVPRWFVILLGIGFLGSLWFSWIYDITPGGIVKTEPLVPERVSIPQKKLKTYRATTFLSLLIIAGLLTYRVIDNAIGKKIANLEKSIAVLPLSEMELSMQQSRKFEFIGHEITSCLLNVKDYRVIPWEDTRKYPRRGKDYTQMGRDLSAAILVDWRPYETASEKHLSVDLVATDIEGLLWSENYKVEGPWTGSEIFKYSRKISKKITRKLRTYLTLEEKALMNKKPVSARASMFASLGVAISNDARELAYTKIRGLDSVRNEYLDSASFDQAIEWFTRAIEEDPGYAKAYAERAKAMLWGIEANYYEPVRYPECEADIVRAFELDPELPEAHIAMGFYYYYSLNEYDLALTSFEKAASLRPNFMEYVFYLSVMHRAMGNWEEVRVLTDQVFESKPHNVLFLTNMGLSYMYLLDLDKSIDCQDRAIELVPQWYAPYINKIEALIMQNKLVEARSVVEDARQNTPNEYYRTLAVLDLYEGKFASAAENMDKASKQEFKDLEESDGDEYLLKAKIYKYAHRPGQAKVFYQMAVDYFHTQLMFNPEDYTLYSKLGIAYAGADAQTQALENAKTAIINCTRQVDNRHVQHTIYRLIQLYALVEDSESAHNMINELLSRNTYYTKEYLRLDPDIQPFMDDYKF
jgi:tetratricopeptide (TPR) repeat protein